VSHSGGRPLALGTLIVNRYRVDALIGVGGFGITYRATDTTLARVVAVKEHVPPGSVRHDDGFLELPTGTNIDFGINRFLDEGRRVAQLRHASIVRVHDVIQDHGTGYLVMEYLEGETLQQAVQRHGALSGARIVPIVRQLGEGLAHMHNDAGETSRATLLHLDISPGNVILVSDPTGVRPVLIDFGSARALTTSTGHRHTRLVKDGYSPPELYEVQTPRTKATDVYSFSATVYFAISGEGPPGFGQAGTAIRQLRATRADIPSSLVEVLASGLQLPIGQRPSSMSEFVRRIEMPAGSGGPQSDERRAHAQSAAATYVAAPILAFPSATNKESVFRPAAIGGAIGVVTVIGILMFLLLRRETKIQTITAPAPSVTAPTIATATTTTATPSTAAITIAATTAPPTVPPTTRAAPTNVPSTAAPIPAPAPEPDTTQTTQAPATQKPTAQISTTLPPPIPTVLRSPSEFEPKPDTDSGELDDGRSPGEIPGRTPIGQDDAIGRSPEDTIRAYYRLINKLNYADAYSIMSGEYRAKEDYQTFAKFWTTKVTFATVRSMSCDNNVPFSACTGTMEFGRTKGGISRENIRVGMEIQDGLWTMNTYTVLSSKIIPS
jgi:serine/threonine protein kinase